VEKVEEVFLVCMGWFPITDRRTFRKKISITRFLPISRWRRL